MKSSLIHLAVMTTLLVAVLLGYGYWYSVVSAKSAEVVQLQSQIDSKNATASYIASVRSALAEISNDEAVVQSYFVSESDVVTFINDLQSRGSTKESVVSVSSVSSVPVSKTSAHPALKLSLKVQGTFDAVLRTIGSIEYAPYDISITSLSVNKKDKKQWTANVNILVGSVAASTQIGVIPPSSYLNKTTANVQGATGPKRKKTTPQLK